jgi:hypothetical protein
MCGRSSWAPVQLSCGADSNRIIVKRGIASVALSRSADVVARTSAFEVRGSYVAKKTQISTTGAPSDLIARVEVRAADLKGGGLRYGSYRAN